MSLNLIEARNISKQYSGHKALDDVSIGVPKGSIYGLLGPNGAGKTSLIRIITRITMPDSGQLLFDGRPISAKDVEQQGYLPEERGLYKKMKVGEQLVYLARLKGMSREDAIEQLKHWFARFEIQNWWNKNVEDLSKGMQQKVQFIATVVHKPALVILDEPFSGFDPINTNLIKEEILNLKAQGSTIIFSTHRMESVEQICDHLALIHNSKKVLEGATAQIRESYRSSLYEVVAEGLLPALPENFKLVSVQAIRPGILQAYIKLSGQAKPNDLLALLMNHVQIHSFSEKLPSISDIFIAHVKGIDISEAQQIKTIDNE